MSVAGTLMKPLFGVSTQDLPAATAEQVPTAKRLQQVVFTVTEGAELALLDSKADTLVPKLDAYPEELKGFVFEGAGVGLAALDYLLPWKQRTKDFVAGAGAPYKYAVYLGAGMGLARIRRNPERFRARLRDPIFSWVVLDGYGFHEGFFSHRRHIQERALPAHLSGYGLQAFDHGLGRSLWFSTGADVDRVVETINAFPRTRQPDLWAGIGLACGYTGGVERATVETLRNAAGENQSRLGEGVLVAAMNRHHVGNPAEHNEIACNVLCGMSSHDAAATANQALVDLPLDDVIPAYQLWRSRLRAQLV